MRDIGTRLMKKTIFEKHTEMSKRIENQREEIESLKEQVNILLNEVTSLKEQINKLIFKDNNKCEEENRVSLAVFREIIDNINNLFDKHEEEKLLLLEIKETNNFLTQEYKNKVERYQNEIKELQENIKIERTENELHKRTAAVNTAELEKIRLDILNREKIIEEKDKKLEEYEKCITDNKIEIANLDEEISSLEKQIENLTSKINDKDDDLKSYDYNFQKIESEKKKLELDLAEIKSTLNLKLEEIREKNNKIENLKQFLDKKNEIIEDVEERLAFLNEDNKKMKQEISIKDDNIKYYERKLEEKNSEQKIIESNLGREQEEILEYKELFSKYEIILDTLLISYFKELREKLEISSQKTKKDYLRIACLMYNLDICKIIYEYFSNNRKIDGMTSEDIELLKKINNFYLEEEITNWNVFFIPDERFEKTLMYDSGKPDRNFSRVEVVYCPGVSLKGDKLTFRAIVKGQ